MVSVHWYCSSGIARLPLVIALGIVVLSPQRISAEEPPRIEQILGAWNARQDKTKSAMFQWTETQTRTKGSTNKEIPTLQREYKEPWPPHDFTFTKPLL